MLRINRLRAHDVSCFRAVDISFSDHYNIICGENGIGKTSILNLIAASFVNSFHISDIKRRAGASGDGDWVLNITHDKNQAEISNQVTSFTPQDRQTPTGQMPIATELLYLRTNRDLIYSPLDSLDANPSRDEAQSQLSAQSGINASEIKLWLAKKWLFAPRMSSKWSDAQKANFESAASAFHKLDSTVRLSHVDDANYDIFVSTSTGVIPFEYLSSGFRATISVIIGIIKELELRSADNDASRFSGVILIDEIDLHLHPAWQRQIANVLKDTFPHAQIIATTHSPHVIQSAQANEVVALKVDEDGSARKAASAGGRHGYRGWSIEEVLQDVMGLSSVHTEEYDRAIKEFEAALDCGDRDRIVSTRNLLMEMLHPSSHLRKIIDISASGLLGPVS